MATENEEQVKQRTKKYALEVEAELKQLKADEQPKAWRQAELIYEVHDKSLWQILGHESVRSYLESLFISRSGWYSKRKYYGEWAKIALEREVITRKRLDRMPMQNVKHLLRLDERRRFDQRWVEKALNMKESDFEAAVDAILAGGQDDDANQPESRAVLRINCTTSQKEFILESFAEFAKRQDPPLELDDEGHILELICADMRAGREEPMDKKAREAREPKGQMVQ
jgi:hypothetical protein